MHSRIVPIFSENTVILFIEIQLIHSEDNQKILGPPLFFNSTRFFIFHFSLPQERPVLQTGRFSAACLRISVTIDHKSKGMETGSSPGRPGADCML